MPISNAEKQARFRKKEWLKKFKDKTFKELQLGMGFGHRRETSGELLSLLNEAASLPSGWTEEDFERACQSINQLKFDFLSPQDDLKRDVKNVAEISEEFSSTRDPVKLKSDLAESISKTRALASHLISALDLSALSNSQRAAAVLEAVRHVGRATHVGRAAERSADIKKSDAMMVCLTSLPSHYERPDWFLDYLTKWLANRLGKELVQELEKSLADFQ